MGPGRPPQFGIRTLLVVAFLVALIFAFCSLLGKGGRLLGAVVFLVAALVIAIDWTLYAVARIRARLRRPRAEGDRGISTGEDSP